MEMTTVCKICRRRCCVDCFANEKSNNSRINNFNTFAIASQNKEQSVKTLLEIKLDAKKLQLEKIKRKEELKAQLLLKKQQKEKLLQLVTNNNQFSGSASLLHQTLSHFDSLLLSQEKHLEKEVEKSKEVQRDISSSILKYEDEIKEERNRIVNEIRSIFPIVPSSNDPENYTSILNFPVPNQYRNPSLRVIDYAFVYGVIINLLSSYAKYLDVWLPNEISHRGSRSSIRNKHGFINKEKQRDRIECVDQNLGEFVELLNENVQYLSSIQPKESSDPLWNLFQYTRHRDFSFKQPHRRSSSNNNNDDPDDELSELINTFTIC